MADGPFVTPPLAIERSFIDHNEHVNMAYHLVLADQAVELALAGFRQDSGYDAPDAPFTTFAGETHIRYLREMNFGDAIVGRVLLVEADAKRVRWAVELRRLPADEVVTTVEGVTLSISRATRRVAPFPEDTRARIAAAVEACGPEVAALDWLGRSVGMKR